MFESVSAGGSRYYGHMSACIHLKLHTQAHSDTDKVSVCFPTHAFLS